MPTVALPPVLIFEPPASKLGPMTYIYLYEGLVVGRGLGDELSELLGDLDVGIDDSVGSLDIDGDNEGSILRDG